MPRTKALRPIFEIQATLCQALAHKVRLEILELISERELPNQDLVDALEIPKANVSAHINILKDVGLVAVRKDGINNYVSLAMPQVKEACALVRAMILEQIKSETGKQQKITGLIKKSF